MKSFLPKPPAELSISLSSPEIRPGGKAQGKQIKAEPDCNSWTPF